MSRDGALNIVAMALTASPEAIKGLLKERIGMVAKIVALEAERDAARAERDGLAERARGMTAIIIVRDPSTGGWECMACNRTAAYNDRDGLEHTADCALSPVPAATAGHAGGAAEVMTK